MSLSWDRTFDWNARDWRVRAACRDSAPDLFFPIGATGLALEQIEAAKAVCARCPVRTECLEFALETNQEAGVWGGTSEEERRHLRRERSARRQEPAEVRGDDAGQRAAADAPGAPAPDHRHARVPV